MLGLVVSELNWAGWQTEYYPAAKCKEHIAVHADMHSPRMGIAPVTLHRAFAEHAAAAARFEQLIDGLSRHVFRRLGPTRSKLGIRLIQQALVAVIVEPIHTRSL